MRILGAVATAAAISACARAHASFELVMAIASDTDAIDRFDGSTGAYLGSFATGQATGTAMTIDQSKGVCYISNFNAGSIQAWDYNTGQFLNEFSTSTYGSVRGIAIDNSGNLLLGTTTGIRRISSTNFALLSTFGNVGVTYTGVEQGADGAYFAVNITSDALERYTSGQALQSAVGLPPGGGTSLQWQIAIAGTQGYVTDNLTCFRFNTTASVPVLGTGYTPSLVDMLGIGVGHTTRRYVSGKQSNVGAIQAFSDLGTSFTTHIKFGRAGMAAGSQYGSLAVVVAPEPSSIAALCLGGLALMRRARRAG